MPSRTKKLQFIFIRFHKFFVNLDLIPAGVACVTGKEAPIDMSFPKFCEQPEQDVEDKEEVVEETSSKQDIVQDVPLDVVGSLYNALHF